MKMVSDNGIEFLLDLPKSRLLGHGEGLLSDDGMVIEVRAEPEALYCVRARNEKHVPQLAWQLGNRHLPAQIGKTEILIRRDPAIKTMLEGLDASTSEMNAPFDPEGGAYDNAEAGCHHHQHGHHHARNQD